MNTPVTDRKKQPGIDRRVPLSRTAWGLLALVALVYLGWFAFMSFTVDGQRWFVLADDAMISMRHAYFLAHGQGLVWNPGQHVEGFTNLGWTLVMAAAHLLPLPLRLTSLVLQLINLALHLLLTTYVYRFMCPRAGEWPALGAALLVGLNAPLLAYGVLGFETSLQTLLVTVALLRFVPAFTDKQAGNAAVPPGLRWVPLWCAFAFLVRPDSITLFLTGSIAALWVSAGDWREQRAILGTIAAGLLLMAGVLAFQKGYYGYWFPNTYYLKASGDTRQLARGIKYVVKFAVQEFQFAFLLAPLAYLFSGLRAKTTRRAFVPASLILGAWVCYLVWVGGDVFSLSRFWTPIIPMLAVCTVLGLCRWQAELSHSRTQPRTNAAWQKAGVGVVAALLGLQLLTGPLRIHTAVKDNKGGAVEGVLYAAALGRSHLAPGTTIGVFLAGTTPYFMPHVMFHDFLGKCDTHISHSPAHWGPPGHNKWDFAYSLNVVQPRYLITDGDYPTSDLAGTDATMRQWIRERKDYGFHPSLWLDPLFRRDYVRTSLSIDGAEITGQQIYVRKSP